MRYLKEKIKLFCSIPCAFYLLVTRKQPRHVVIYYHSVKKHQVEQFQNQMAYLATKCFVVKPSKIMSEPADGSKVVAAITFDDAFASVIDNAVPIMKKYELPAGIFVPVDNLGQKPRWEILGNISDKDEVVINKEQIVELDKEGFEIFSHTGSHSVLTKIDDDRLESELAGSKQNLENIIGHEVIGISYPQGAYDARVCEATRRAGYKLGFTIEPGLISSFTDDFRIGRTSVSPDDSLIKFKLKVNGAYHFPRFLKTTNIKYS